MQENIENVPTSQPGEYLIAKNKIEDGLTKASEIYSNQTMLRAAIAAIPYVGGSIDILFANRAQSVFQNRVKTFIGCLAIEFQKLKESAVNKDYFESEEGIDLLIKAFEAAMRTRSNEKIELYSKILTGAAEIRNKENNMGESYLSVLSELSVEELELAKIIYDMQKTPVPDAKNKLAQTNDQGWKDLPNRCSKYIRDNITFYLKRLESKGLISEITGSFYGYSGGNYSITDTFRNLMYFIGGSDYASPNP